MYDCMIRYEYRQHLLRILIGHILSELQDTVSPAMYIFIVINDRNSGKEFCSSLACSFYTCTMCALYYVLAS